MEKYLQLESEHDKVKLAHGLVQQSMEYQTKEMLHRKVSFVSGKMPEASVRLPQISSAGMGTAGRAVEAACNQKHDIDGDWCTGVTQK